MITYSKDELLTLYNGSIDKLLKIAGEVNSKHKSIELCAIVNAKSGACSEDCKYCAQSAHYDGAAEIYPLLNKEEILKRATSAKENGAVRYGIVTSGVSPKIEDFENIIELIRYLKTNIDLHIDASLGIVTISQLAELKAAGLTRYHHNLETSRDFFPKITTTHSYDERYEVAKNVKAIGLELCCGGIFGIGESDIDRISLAIDISKIAPTAIPINFLVPIKGTPLENIQPVDIETAQRTIAIFRIICHNSSIVLAGGRSEILQAEQLSAFRGGANGMIIGDLLTTPNEKIENDKKLVQAIKNKEK